MEGDKIATGKDIHSIIHTFPSSNKCPTLSYVKNTYTVQNKSNRKENQCLIKDNLSTQSGVLSWNKDTCNTCGTCVAEWNDVCPERALSIDEDYNAIVVDSSKCIGCTLCYDMTINICPFEAYDIITILIV